MNTKNNIPIFPHPKNKNENFVFKDGKFMNPANKDDQIKILEFSKNTEGWTDELTEMADHHIDVNHPIDVASREMCIDFLEKYDMSEKKVVLEIGCSSGNLINKIKEKEKYYYIGSDAIKKQIEKLSNYHRDIPFIIFDLLKNPFKENFCNSLIMLNVLEHIKDDNEALIQANKILNKNGILIIEVPSGKFLYDDYDRKLLHFRRYNMREIVRKIENAGFKIEKKTHLGFLIFPIFALVKIFNKFFKNKDIVIKQAKISNNFFLKMVFNIEKKLSNFYLPFGIRCYICARKK
tara:strand:+ start:46 stop:921 length:876 start_codon:yes stop_codon:yes gene_type:complete